MASQLQKQLFSDLVYAALLDGDVQQEDLERLARYGKEIGLQIGDCAEVIAEVQEGRKKSFAGINNEMLQLAMFERFVKFVLIDGQIDRKEAIFLEQMAACYGLQRDEVDAIIEDAREHPVDDQEVDEIVLDAGERDA